MNPIEKNEINNLIKKYQCENDTQIILDNLFNTGKINKSKMRRNGLNDKNIQAILTRLSLTLCDYNPNEEK